ncbi:hypothetical protein CCACVL1_25154 [Corchorus capsularis]|uniref:Factor of DNA methylation 1-5/IDN2 domain-containing protein n=1 Tax=Corchorus capsularis TaxID=210143 RepID=A0A1R3GLT0_COCAP|nr:hypothetical protein CCACVL1_25154 [Corchorus capsularis]
MEARCTENSKSLEVLMEEKDYLLQAYNVTKSAREDFQRILNGHEKLKSHLESYKNDLELRELELEKREAVNENKRKMLAEELEQVEEVIDADEERLLRYNIGDDVFNAVTSAIKKLNENYQRGKYKFSELWNAKEERKATVAEGIGWLLEEWNREMQATNDLASSNAQEKTSTSGTSQETDKLD